MSVESPADRAAFLADWGLPIDWAVGAATSEDIIALFDAGAISDGLQQSLSALNRRATLTLREADVPAGAGAPADVITIGGVSYHPKAMQPDGQGMMVVTLESV